MKKTLLETLPAAVTISELDITSPPKAVRLSLACSAWRRDQRQLGVVAAKGHHIDTGRLELGHDAR